MVGALITRADDFGASQASNTAICNLLSASRFIRNVSCMAVGPLMESGAELLAQMGDPTISFGLHGSITSEWDYLKWFPLSEARRIPSLLDGETFPPSFEGARRAIEADEVVREFAAQLDFLTRIGIAVTYLDTHMMPERFHPELIPALSDWARTKGLIYHLDWCDGQADLGPHGYPDAAEGLARWRGWMEGHTDACRVALMHPMLAGREALAFANGRSRPGEVARQRSIEYELAMSGRLDACCEERGIARVSYESAAARYGRRAP